LYYILGHEPYDRGELVDAGGVGSEESDSERTPETPLVAPDPAPRKRPGLSSKRATREYSLQSPVKKKSTKSVSVDDCISSYHTLLQKTLEEKINKKTEEEEKTARIRQLLLEDGYSESDMYFQSFGALQRSASSQGGPPHDKCRRATTVCPSCHSNDAVLEALKTYVQAVEVF
jgi:hypothetical protein